MANYIMQLKILFAKLDRKHTDIRWIKMKFYYILIVFALVKVVFATDIADLKENLKKQVVITNNHIRSAFHQGKLHDAVKYIICQTVQGTFKYSLVDIAFMMTFLPVSESLDNFNTKKLEEFIKYQLDMQYEIWNATNINVPEIQPGYNFNDRLYSDLRRERRLMIKDALIGLIINNKTLPGPDFSETRFSEMCRAVGLFKSIISPDSRIIISAKVGKSNTCTLTACDESVSVYKPIKGRVYQVDVDPPKLLLKQAYNVQYVEL